MLKTLIAEVKQQVARRAGETNDPLTGLSAAVTVGRGQVQLTTTVQGSKRGSFNNNYKSECSQRKMHQPLSQHVSAIPL